MRAFRTNGPDGRHSLVWLEKGDGSDTQTWVGNSNCGIFGSIFG